MLQMARESADEQHTDSPINFGIASNALREKLNINWIQLNSQSNDLACSSTCSSQLMPLEADRTTPAQAELCLLICSLFPVDFRLPIEDLVVCGMALKLFGDVHDIGEGRNKAYGLIKIINHQLPPRYLNKLCLWEDQYGSQFVKVFDIAKDLAKSIASKYQLVLHYNEFVKGKWPNTIWYEYFYGLSVVPENLECLQLALMQLQPREDSRSSVVDMFDRMKELMILSLDVPSMPESLNVLCNLRTLRFNIVKLEDMSWIGCLMNLELLSISTPCLTDIPEEMGQLINLRLLDLRKMSIAYIPPGVLSRMLKLEELYLPLSFKSWGLRAKELDDYDEWEEDDCDEKESIGTSNDQMERINASISDITSLSLYALEISIPDSSVLPKNSSMFNKVRWFKIFVPNNLRYRPPGQFHSTNVLQLTGNAHDMKVSGICELMSRAEDLSLLKVRNLMNVMFQLNVFPGLQKMIVSECDDLEYFVDTTEKRTLPEDGSLFSNLETLHLSMLPNLKQIWHGRLASLLSFGNLTQISIRFCNKLKYVFPLSIVGGSTRLKNIQILDCTEMNGIFYQCEEDDTADVLYTVEELHLHSLPKLIGFLVHVDDKICWVYNDTDQAQTTKEIVLSSMDGSICSLDINIKSFSTNEKTSRVNENCIDDEAVICPTPISASGGNSQENASHQFVSSQQDPFTVNKGLIGCTEKSIALISSKAAKKWMQDLKRLEITFCDALQVIFSFEDNHFITRAFNSLIELRLVGLRNLVHIWFQVPPKLTAFQNLQLLVISKCRILYVFSPCVAKLLVQLQKLYINQCERMEEVVMKVKEKESDDKIVFPQLQFLECERSPNLKVFYSGAVDLPLLECLKINQCNKMKCISDKSTRAPQLKRILINGSLCASMGDLNATVQRDSRHCETPAAVDDACSAINAHSPDDKDGSEPDELVGSSGELDDPDGTYSNKSEDDSNEFDGCDELNMLDETGSTSTVDMFTCEVNGLGNESCIHHPGEQGNSDPDKLVGFHELHNTCSDGEFGGSDELHNSGDAEFYGSDEPQNTCSDAEFDGSDELHNTCFDGEFDGSDEPHSTCSDGEFDGFDEQHNTRSRESDGYDELDLLNETGLPDSTSTVDMFACEVNGQGNNIWIKEFSFADLEIVTNNFSSEALIGEGDFSEVYKGWLGKRSFSPSITCTGMPVAIKKLKSSSDLIKLRQLQSEKYILERLSHPNVIKLVGYCREDHEMLLVYEFMQRGHDHLFKRNLGAESLSWDLRLKIAIGAARGLVFLHTLESKVIHSVVKPSNILVDGDYNARITDFGSAVLVPSNSIYRSGTFGYVETGGHFTEENDVYSFGVVLLQLMTGSKIDPERWMLFEWYLRPTLKQERGLKEIMDPTIQGQYSTDAMLLIAKLASKCTESDPKRRPTMTQVLKKLQQIDGIK